MSIAFLQGLEYLGPDPDFTRQQYATLADMKAVKKGRMPEMYIGFCLETRKWYQYDKNNETDEVLGKWREWSGGGGESIQKTVLPEASETELSKIYQYVGVTGTYTHGFFYECTAEEHTTTVDVTTVTQFTELISNSELTVQIKLADESVIDTPAYEFGGVFYFVYEDTIYGGTKVEDIIVVADSTAYTTDEQIVALGITYESTSYTYSWENVDVSSGGGTVESIPLEDIDEMFE